MATQDNLLIPAKEFSNRFNDLQDFMARVNEITGGNTSTQIDNISDFSRIIQHLEETLVSSPHILSADGVPGRITISPVRTPSSNSEPPSIVRASPSSNREKMNRTNVIGGIIISKICQKQLEAYMRKEGRTTPEIQLAEKRFNYFKSPQFIIALNESLPFRTGPRGSSDISSSGLPEGEDDEDSGAGSYTEFLNHIFQVTSKKFKWRGQILAPISNDLQCIRAAKSNNDGGIQRSDPESKVREYQDTNTMRCYICGGIMGQGQNKMQCEHILPIITALAHWWLVKPPGGLSARVSVTSDVGVTNPQQGQLSTIDELANEYAFSHACCNLIKNNN